MDITGSFNQPTEVAVADNGQILVLDGANNRVAAFDEAGLPLYRFGKPGQGNGEFKNPVGLCLDRQQRIHVADTGNRRIQIFGLRGDYIREIDLSPWNARPVDVTVNDDTGRLYVSDAANHQILCFDKDGRFDFAWGAYGKGPGEFKFPGMASIDAEGNLFAVDILNGRIQVFDSGGRNLRQVGTLGILPGQLFRPKGLAIDSRSRIFVADSYTGIIQVFDGNGGLYGILSRGPAEFLRLTTPIGMAFGKNGRFCVVQASLNTISVYQLSDTE